MSLDDRVYLTISFLDFCFKKYKRVDIEDAMVFAWPPTPGRPHLWDHAFVKHGGAGNAAMQRGDQHGLPLMPPGAGGLIPGVYIRGLSHGFEGWFSDDAKAQRIENALRGDLTALPTHGCPHNRSQYATCKVGCFELWEKFV